MLISTVHADHLCPRAAHAAGRRARGAARRLGSAGRLRHVRCSCERTTASAPGSFVERTFRFSNFQITDDINASFSQHDLEFGRKACEQTFHCVCEL